MDLGSRAEGVEQIMQDAIKALEEQIIERNRRIGELEKQLAEKQEDFEDICAEVTTLEKREAVLRTAKETPEEVKERLWKEHVNPWRGRAGSTIELKIEQIHQLARIAEALKEMNNREWGLSNTYSPSLSLTLSET